MSAQHACRHANEVWHTSGALCTATYCPAQAWWLALARHWVSFQALAAVAREGAASRSVAGALPAEQLAVSGAPDYHSLVALREALEPYRLDEVMWRGPLGERRSWCFIPACAALDQLHDLGVHWVLAMLVAIDALLEAAEATASPGLVVELMLLRAGVGASDAAAAARGAVMGPAQTRGLSGCRAGRRCHE